MPRPRLLAAAAALLAVAPGALSVSLPGTQPGQLTNWPLQAPRSCHRCHADYDPAATYEAWETWAGSMKANAARDPLLWAALDIANQDAPDVGDFCIRCHAPRGWLEGRSTPADGSALQGSPEVEGNDYEGVTCDFCHRVHENPSPPLGELPFYTENAQYWIDDTGASPVEPPPRRGPYPDVVVTQHAWVRDPLYQESRYCGLCHNVTNPLHNLRDELGGDTGVKFPLERTYREWQQSDFASSTSPDRASCQDCHLRPQAGWGCADMNPARPEVFPHDFAGGNAWMPQVLAGEYPLLARQESYAYTVAKAREMLAAAASLTVAAPPTAPAGAPLDLTTRVTNRAGHKLPTGYPEGRRMWLAVTVRDGNGLLLGASGAYDTATATLVYDGQIKVYEAKPGIYGQGATFHFIANDYYEKDNRIPPRGFQPDVETRPWGYTYPDLGGGILAHWDDTPYSFLLPPAIVYPLAVEARLLYQTASREYIEFLRDENRTSTRGQEMYTLWQRYGMAPPEEMARATARVGNPAGDQAPNDVGNGLLLVHGGGGPGEVRLVWRNSVADYTHDAAESYEAHGESSTADPWAPRLAGIPPDPDGTTEATDLPPVPPPAILFYRIVARNPGGVSP